MNKNEDDLIIGTNISENEQKYNNYNETKKESEIYNSTYSTKDDIIKKESLNGYNKKRPPSKSIANPNFFKNDNNLRNSRMTKFVQAQIDKKFSLDNLGIISLAEEHRSANRPLHKINNLNKETKFCQCCNLPCPQKGILEPFKFTDSIHNFAVCGKGVYLYFLYIIFAVFCCFIIIFISSISFDALSKDYYKNVIELCNKENMEEKCNNIKMVNKELVWSYKYSIYTIKTYRELCLNLNENKKICNKGIVNYSIISFFCMMTLFVFNITCLYIFHYLNNKLKIGILLSDYTLLITNLDYCYDDFIKQNSQDQLNIDKFILYLKEKLFNSNSETENKDFSKKIYSINLCYKINEYMKTQKICEEYKYKIFQIKHNPYQKKKNEKLKIADEKKKCYFLMPFTFFGCLCSLKKEDTLENLENKKLKKESELLNSIESGEKLNKFAGCIFVTFNTVKDKEKYYNKYPHYFIEILFHFIKNLKYYFHCISDKNKRKTFNMKKKINVFYANEPEDVIWENMEYTKTQRIKRSLFIYFISLILLFILFLIVFQLTYIQDKLNKKENWKFITINFVSFSIALAIVIVNKLFQLLLEWLTEIEKHHSFSKFYLSCSVKLTIFAFITSAIIPFICNALKRKEDKDNNLMIKNITNLFIVNAIVLPLPFTLVLYYFKKFRIWLINRKPKEHCKTQKELNDLYELPDMNISYKYSDVCQTILMTFFYMPIFPLGAVFSAIGLILTFICQKLYFIHFYKRPEMLNESICKFYLEYFIWNILIYAVGDYIFTYEIYEKSTWSLCNLILFAILTIIPYNKLILLYLDNKKIIITDSTPLSTVYFSFYNDYERQNPITKKEGLCKCIKALREKKKISEKVEKIMTSNVEKINIMEVYYRASIRHSLVKSQFAFADNIKLPKSFTKIGLDNDNISLDSNYNKSKTKSNNETEKELKVKEEENQHDKNSGRKEDNAIIEEVNYNQIIQNNNCLMLSSLRNPFLFGINDTIRISLNEAENTHINKEIKDIISSNNITQSIKINDINNPKFQINTNQKLEDIFEESKEEDACGVTKLNDLFSENETVKMESKDSRAELDSENIYGFNNKRNNPLFKSSILEKNDIAINIFNNSSLNQSYKIKKKEKDSNNNSIRKSYSFFQKKSFNEE